MKNKKKDVVALTIQVTDPESLAKTEWSKGRGGDGERRELREGAEEVGGKAAQTTESQEFYCLCHGHGAGYPTYDYMFSHVNIHFLRSGHGLGVAGACI